MSLTLMLLMKFHWAVYALSSLYGNNGHTLATPRRCINASLSEAISFISTGTAGRGSVSNGVAALDTSSQLMELDTVPSM